MVGIYLDAWGHYRQGRCLTHDAKHIPLHSQWRDACGGAFNVVGRILLENSFRSALDRRRTFPEYNRRALKQQVVGANRVFIARWNQFSA